MEKLIQHTNQKLKNWYDNAKLDYDVIGTAKAVIENGLFIINYTENGIQKKWSVPFYTEYLSLDINYFFNVWSEQK